MTHPLDMSLSLTGWAIDPDLLSDIRLDLIHSDTTGDCFLVKVEFKNGTDAEFQIDIKEGGERRVYDALTDALRVPRMAPVISGVADGKA